MMGGPPAFTVLGDEDTAKAKEAEAANPFRPTPSTPSTVWACALCLSWDDRSEKIKEHLADV